MKIIHTSDWHLGQNFHGYDRREDHYHMIGQLVELVGREQPDALVIAGDVYDVGAPAASVMKDFSRYMVALHDACKDMAIVCISGNHDSASRHVIFQEPWEALGVYMIGRANVEDLAPNIVKVGDKGYVVAVPYTHERFLDDDFYDRLEAEVRRICGGDTLPIIYTGHASITDCDYDGHDKVADRYIGNIECTSVECIGKTYDYIALGHIHKEQTFYGGRARYCGSPVAVSFDEVKPGYEHGFTVVEIAARGAEVRISKVPVIMKRPLVNIPSSGFASWNDVLKELMDFPDDTDAYIRLNVELEAGESLPYDQKAQIANAMNGKVAVCCQVNPKRKIMQTPAGGSVAAPMELEELKKEDPLNLIRRYFSSQGVPFTKDFEEMLHEAYQAANYQSDEDKDA